MANINVVFPKSGKPLVTGDPKGCLSNEPITWQVYSLNKRLKSVKIEFQKGDFFKDCEKLGGPKACTKNFTVNDSGGYTVMVGVSPKIAKKNGKRRTDKYTIYGYTGTDGGGTMKVKLDPKIITDPPPAVGGGG